MIFIKFHTNVDQLKSCFWDNSIQIVQFVCQKMNVHIIALYSKIPDVKSSGKWQCILKAIYRPVYRMPFPSNAVQKNGTLWISVFLPAIFNAQIRPANCKLWNIRKELSLIYGLVKITTELSLALWTEENQCTRWQWQLKLSITFSQELLLAFWTSPTLAFRSVKQAAASIQLNDGSRLRDNDRYYYYNHILIQP